ncbi:MAG: hypothetical protein WDZ66_13415 [Steroidobacteraceae bacterium]
MRAPQIRSWEDFEHFTAQVAVEFLEDDAASRSGVIELSGDTVVDLDARLVKVAKPKADRMIFTGRPGAEQEGRIRSAVEREPLEIPAAAFLFHLTDDVVETPPPREFNTDPPLIDVVETPALSCSSKTRRHWGRGRPYSSRRCFFALCRRGRVGAAE